MAGRRKSMVGTSIKKKVVVFLDTYGANNYTVPAHVGVLMVDCYGAASQGYPGNGGPGAGGNFSRKSTLVVSPGDVIPYFVDGLAGQASTWFKDTSTVRAYSALNGGVAGGGSDGVPGPTGVGDLQYFGGHGLYAGGAGGCAGPNGNGANGGHSGTGDSGGGGANGGSPGGAPTGTGGVNRFGSGGGVYPNGSGSLGGGGAAATGQGGCDPVYGDATRGPYGGHGQWNNGGDNRGTIGGGGQANGNGLIVLTYYI
jgi:hypothetical protein